jgi:Icc protein
MPVHLPPLSRRRFLTTSLAAGAGLVLLKPLLAAAKPVDQHDWILFSDTHISADRNFVHKSGTNMAKNLGRAVEESINLPNRAAGVLVCGDCAYLKGEPGDYSAFTDLLNPIRAAGMPVHVTLGNHDDRENLWNAVADAKSAKRALADHHVALLKSERANWYVLDSMEKVNVTPGILGESQLEWLTKALDENKSQPAIVMVHHNLQKGETKTGLKDTDKLLAIIEPRKQVKALVYGHTHHWDIKQEASGIHFINLPPVAYPFNNTDPNGWVLATLQAGGMKLKFHAFDTAHKAHGQVTELKWRAG